MSTPDAALTATPADVPAPPRRRRRWRRVAALMGLGGLWGMIHSTGYLSALGGTPDGERLARMANTARFVDGQFVNLDPAITAGSMASPEGTRHVLWRWLFGKEERRPEQALPVLTRTTESFATPAAEGLEVTWLGHSTLIVEVDGHRFLTDPVFSDRASPSSLVGPSRFHAPPIAIADLPALDAVVISHDHYDHLDEHSIRALNDRGERFLVPLGVGAHLVAWGVPEDRIREFDWWDELELRGGLRVVAAPAQHFSGRGLFDKNATLWTSWAFIGPTHRAYFSGDTGLFPQMSEIGERLGPFDLTMLEVGAFDVAWSDIHMGPEGALEAHRRLRGRTLLPVHWGTFQLALHAWTQPAEVLLAEAGREVEVAFPRPGESVTVGGPVPAEPWWRLAAREAEAQVRALLNPIRRQG
ncbi:MBL fold metallo-hydrolase [Haliangium sp.]|uniref:MBL fold metallo-hydrolase n=1 Tax=Haliangium sp. TaxID=2663208 RepID=UPI003D0B51D3